MSDGGDRSPWATFALGVVSTAIVAFVITPLAQRAWKNEGELSVTFDVMPIVYPEEFTSLQADWPRPGPWRLSVRKVNLVADSERFAQAKAMFPRKLQPKIETLGLAVDSEALRVASDVAAIAEKEIETLQKKYAAIRYVTHEKRYHWVVNVENTGTAVLQDAYLVFSSSMEGTLERQGGRAKDVSGRRIVLGQIGVKDRLTLRGWTPDHAAEIEARHKDGSGLVREGVAGHLRKTLLPTMMAVLLATLFLGVLAGVFLCRISAAPRPEPTVDTLPKGVAGRGDHEDSPET